MSPLSFSQTPEPALGQILDVTLDPLTLADDDVIKYDITDKIWKNAPDGASGGNAATIDVTENNSDGLFYPTFVDSAGTTKTLNCNASTTPWSVNPNTGEFLVIPTIKVGGDIANGRVAIGANAGVNSLQDTTNCGHSAGEADQQINACAFGLNAGNSRQQANACAFGPNSAVDRQGRSSVAVGNGAAGVGPQPDNQICLNASGIAFTGTNAQACYINPIARRDNGSGVGNLSYNTLTFEVTYSGT